MTSYVQRYMQGECRAVWNELMALGESVREESLSADAWAVAKETMRRVRYNLALVVPRLRALGYVFLHDPLPERPPLPRSVHRWIQANPPVFTEPAADITHQLENFEQGAGVLPLSLRAFYEVVGGVNFVGWYPGSQTKKGSFLDEAPGASKGFDPVFVYAFRPDLREEVEECISPEIDHDDLMSMGGEEREPFEADKRSALIIAPDVYHKANVSGGAPLQIELPDANADAPLLYEPHRTTFVNYLRICCSYAGLPGLEEMQNPLSEKLDELRAGMLPV